MKASLFKSRFLINEDGTESAMALTNANTVFVHTYIGDDNTGDGTREFPFRSMNRAISKYPAYSFIVFRGVINEYFSVRGKIIGDDINQIIISQDYSPLLSIEGNVHNCRQISVDTILRWDYNSQYERIIFNNKQLTTIEADFGIKWYRCFNGGNFMGHGNYNNPQDNNCTYRNIKRLERGVLLNSIYYEYFGLYFGLGKITTIKYCIFSSKTSFLYYNGSSDVVISPQPIFGNNSKDNIQILRDAYTNGTGVLGLTTYSSANMLLIFPKDSFGKETCQIVKEAKDGGTLPNIFNEYNIDGTVKDWTLNNDVQNVALWASDTGGYVGCFRPNYPVANSGSDSVINVNTDGSDTGTAGTLLVKNADDSITFDTASAQLWNRIKGNTTIHIQNGTKFNGLQGLSNDGSPFGYFIGKYQNLVDPTPIYEGDALVPGERYKASNTTSQDITKAITYRGVNYLPDYFFTAVGTQSFTLLNAGSGSYLNRVIADPLESVEILPYDDATTPSAFPRFSAPLLGECKLLYYSAAGATRFGKTMGVPVLFSDLAGANFVTDCARTGKVATISIVAGGTGYSIGNILTLATPSGGRPATVMVTAVSGGVVTGAVIVGKGYLYTTGTKATTVLPAGGSGCTIGVSTVENETVISDKISYYDAWAISNADWEFQLLTDPSFGSPKNTYFTSAIPLLSYLRIEINGHFNQPYDL